MKRLFFQPETSITIEKLPSKSKTEVKEFKEFLNGQMGKILFFTILLCLFLSFLVNILALPRACNENPQSSIMKLESQVQKFGSKFQSKIQDWFNSEDQFAIFGKYFLGFGLAVIFYFLHDTMMKIVPLPTLTISTFYPGFCWLGAMVARDFIFQDSTDRCKFEITRTIEDSQMFGLVYFAFLIFIKLQHFLSKRMKLN